MSSSKFVLTFFLNKELEKNRSGERDENPVFLCGREGAIWFPCWVYSATVRSLRPSVSRVSRRCLPGRGWMQHLGQRLCLSGHPSTGVYGIGNFWDEAWKTAPIDRLITWETQEAGKQSEVVQEYTTLPHLIFQLCVQSETQYCFQCNRSDPRRKIC